MMETQVEPGSVVDYTFPDDSWSLKDVTLRTAMIDGRLHGRLLGTSTVWCQYSDDGEDGEFTEKHTFDITTDYQDLAKVTDLPHRVAYIPTSEEIRAYTFARPMLRKWNDDDCPRKPAHDERERVREQAARRKAARRAASPPGVTTYGTPMTPPHESLEETAEEDAEIAARAIDYASRYGRMYRVPGHAVADAFYDALGKGGEAWSELAVSLALTVRSDRWIAVGQEFGPDAIAAVAGSYGRVFAATLEHHLKVLGQGGYPVEDPNGPIRPWLLLFGAMERDAKPSLVRRFFRR